VSGLTQYPVSAQGLARPRHRGVQVKQVFAVLFWKESRRCGTRLATPPTGKPKVNDVIFVVARGPADGTHKIFPLPVWKRDGNDDAIVAFVILEIRVPDRSQ